MQFRREILVAAVSLVLFAAGAPGVEAADFSGFDFKYGQEGDRALLPVQVFDDGSRTYFQFPSSASLPMINASTDSGRKMLAPEFKQPYVVVEGVYSSFLLTSKDGAKGVVTYSGGAHRLSEKARGLQAGIAQKPAPQLDALYTRALPTTSSMRGSEDGDQLLDRIRGMLDGNQERPLTPMQSAQARADRIPIATYYGEAGTSPLAVPVSRPSNKPAVSFRGRFDKDVYASARDQVADSTKATTSHVTNLKDGDAATAEDGAAPPKYIVDLRSREERDRKAEVGVLRREMSAPASAAANAGGMLRAGFNGGGSFRKTAAALEGTTSLREDLQLITSFYERRLITREQAEALIRKLVEQPTQGQPAAAPQATLAGRSLFGSPEATEEKWEIRLGDKTLRRAIERWGKANGYQVSWEAPVDFPVKLEATFVGRFEDAIKAVMLSLRDTQTPMEAFVYDNRVIRIVPQGTKSPNK